MSLRFIIYCLLPSILFASSIARNSVWYDETGLWQDVANKSPDNALALNNLCRSLYKEKARYDDAMEVCLRSLKIEPQAGEVHLNLWQIYKAKGMWVEAQEESKLGLKLAIGKPEAYNMLGYYLLKKGWFDEAIRIFKIGIEKMSGLADNHYGIAVSFEKKGLIESALIHYREFLRLADRKDLRIVEVKGKLIEIERNTQ